MSEFRCDGWSAVHDRAPGKENALTVTGVCHAPQEGWSFVLHRADEAPAGDGDGAGPELHLRLDVDRPQVAPEHRTDVQVEFVTFVDDDVQKVSIDGVAEVPVQEIR